MTIAILEAGAPPAELQPHFGRYDAMVARLFGDAPTRSYDVRSGRYPGAPDDHHAYVVTGSPAGVYDDLPWIPGLIAFLQAAKGRAKLVGICFGHQVMSQAFGGQVERSARGWGIGLHRYAVHRLAPWMDDVPHFRCPVSHQDQVVVAPPSAEILAGNE